jgi:predicted short-subunit dehydrogenase-like oxidoreductase (DUF2520 family)
MEKVSSNTASPTVALIGAGNLAVNLARALRRGGFRILQVYSRTEQAARTLAESVGAGYTVALEEVTPHADIYVVALTDSALSGLIPAIVAGREQALFVHTAGSIPMKIWEGHADRHGVLYPMQTFSKQREVEFREIPIFIESNSDEDERLLHDVASRLSGQVYGATSEQRRSLHLAAVFACNFTNAMYRLAAEVLEQYDLPFSAMLPLIDETAAKVHRLSPRQAQTGPAARGDEAVMAAHLEMLRSHPEWEEIYRLMSRRIADTKR